MIPMGAPRLEIGLSDPLSYRCSCSALGGGGIVLLFYRYWANEPRLPAEERQNVTGLERLAGWHRSQTENLHLTGKLRIAPEGYNITVAGTGHEIGQYIKACVEHWSFSGLDLGTEEKQSLFFKPSQGCACVFGPEKTASVRVTAEITPMGVEGYTPSNWASVEVLTPAEFHERCHEHNITLLDVRNVYESRIGYFVSPQTGKPANRPPIRRFSQWPQYIQNHLPELNAAQSTQVVTYCTGGIRCEKVTRWMQEKVGFHQDQKICTLQGGIAAYLTWMDKEIQQGRKQATDSLFRGRNYVFDARGSTGLTAGAATEPVATCHVCATPTDHLSKCRSNKCHLILVVCEICDGGDPRCCQNCRELEQNETVSTGPRPMCTCERQREAQLWDGSRVKAARTQGWRKVKRMPRSDPDHISITVKTIDE